jgi:hypothetical protein
VSSWLAKPAAGDDAWDTAGVVDVSNQLKPRVERPAEIRADQFDREPVHDEEDGTLRNACVVVASSTDRAMR